MSAAPTANAFLYIAVRPGGGRKFGVRQAGSPTALAQSLRAENQLLLKTYRLPAWLGGAAQKRELSLKDQAELNDQLAQLLSRGVPLVEALDVVAQTVRASSRPIVARLRDMVSSGSSFADACKTVGAFDNVTIAVYRGAERTGDLAGASKELAQTARRRLQVSGKAATLMIYPIIVMGIAVIVTSILMLVVVPMMADGLSKMDIKLPLYSRVIMAVSVWARDNVIWLALGVAVLAAAALFGRALIAAAAALLMRRLPVMRDVVIAQECARFFSVMAAMTRTGVPIADALGVANQVISHPTLRSQLDRLRVRLVEGGLLRVLIDEVQSLPIASRRLLVAAERAGDLESAFVTLAQDMTDQVDRTSARALAVLEPLLIVVMFVVIGALIMAIMLPMLTLTNRVNLG